jgi:hypothetical protein
MTFVLRRGSYSAAKMEYSYGRRAQSTVYSLHWADVATIDTPDLQDAVDEALAALTEWSSTDPSIATARWQLEGRGVNSGFCQEISRGEIV